MKILVTGAAGFIGYHLCSKLLDEEIEIVGIDNLNDYYDPQIKKSRLSLLENQSKKAKFSFRRSDISKKEDVKQIFEKCSYDVVINLAAQAGVRYSIENPSAYISSNIIGFQNILDHSVLHGVQKIIFASSSSVYGGNKTIPYNEDLSVNNPNSLYAATKISNEAVAASYAHLHKIPIIGLRFFTVYGPWGRPDMAYFKFTKNILNDQKIDVYAIDQMKRDFTHIEDIVDGIIATICNDTHDNNFELINLGNNDMVDLSTLINIIESECGKKAIINHLPKQKGDVLATYADISKAKKLINYSPTKNIYDGIKEFVQWYKVYSSKTL